MLMVIGWNTNSYICLVAEVEAAASRKGAQIPIMGSQKKPPTMNTNARQCDVCSNTQEPHAIPAKVPETVIQDCKRIFQLLKGQGHDYVSLRSLATIFRQRKVAKSNVIYN